MDTGYHRGMLLFQSGRFEDAARELRGALADSPNDPYLHGLLALSLVQSDKFAEAIIFSRKAIELDPENAHHHFILARVLVDHNEIKEAKNVLNESIRLEPEEVDHYGLLARICFEEGRWQETVAASDQGLAIEADDDVCLHYRALALTKLGRQDEAQMALDRLMTLDPEDAATHVAKGWHRMEAGKNEEASKHFREALRIDPTNADARDGFVTTLKTRHPFYSWMLRSFLFLDRFRGKSIWIILIGALVAFRFLNQWQRQYPEWMIGIILIKAAIYTYGIGSIIANPLFNLLLRLDPEGKLALTESQIKASNWNAGLILVSLGFGFWWSIGNFRLGAGLALGFLALTNLVSETFDASHPWVRKRLKALTIILAVALLLSPIGIIGVVLLVLKNKFLIPILKPALLVCTFLPFAITLAGLLADNIREYLDRRRPDL